MAGVDLWSNVIETALQRAIARYGTPVTGAQFHKYVAAAAAQASHELPADTKFLDFLTRYPDVVAVLRRSDRDALIAPADSAASFVKPDSDVTVRSDIFVAFTRIRSERRAWYQRLTDGIGWFPEGLPPNPEDFAQIPPATLNGELADRVEFIATIQDADARNDLTGALSDQNPLGAFKHAVARNNFGARWHTFRTQAIVKRIQEWATVSEVPWQESWLSSGTSAPPTAHQYDEMATRTSKLLFAEFVDRLEPDDLARISIPLDIVAKLFGNEGTGNDRRTLTPPFRSK